MILSYEFKSLFLWLKEKEMMPTPFLGTCSCQQGVLLFAYDPVWILYLPCCKLLKGHSLLTFYKLTVLFSVGGGKIFCFLWLFRSFS